MNLTEALENLSKNEFPKLINDYAATVGELWAKVYDVHFPDFDRVKTMFTYLKRYVEEPDAVFAIRAGNTRANNDGKTLRRGFLTAFKHDKRRFFYTDNDFATIIAKLIHDADWVMNYDEFKQAMLDRTFPVHFNASCTEEKDKAAYKIDAQNPGIGDGGYKVSHLVDVGTNYYFGGTRLWNLSKICEEYFPLEDYDKWKRNADGYYVREIDGALSSEQEQFLKAHFLRFACPLNYIFTPKQSGQIFGEVKIPKNDVGECPELLMYAKEQLKERYPDEYNEYFSLLMLPPEKLEDYPLDVSYVFKGKKKRTKSKVPAAKKTVKGKTAACKTSPSTKASTKKTAKASKSKSVQKTLAELEAEYSRDKLIEIAAFYLRNNVGLKKIEGKFKLTERLGFEAQNILQVFGIPTDGLLKGLLQRTSIDDAIAGATDATLQHTLEEIKVRGL